VDVSVVVPAHNAAGVIGQQLGALARQRCARPWEVVVVDDHSSDGTGDVARSFTDRLPGLVVLKTPRKSNPASARNAGAAAAAGTALLFCDADDVVSEDWVSRMADALLTAHLVAGPLDLHRLNPPWVRATRPDSQEHGLQVWDVGGTRWLRHAVGPNLGISRQLWEAIAGFDEELDAGEDIDLCFRAQLAGYDLRYVPEATVHYRQRDSLPAIYRQARAWGTGSLHLERKFVPRGMPRPSRLRLAMGWARLPVELLGVRDRGGLGRWLHRLGWRVGRVRAAVGLD
jgi:glycosyltransferase involved in cell wall biosynthesis